MQALKALVIFMGILIAIGVTVVGVTIYRRATDTTSRDTASNVSAPATPGQTAPQTSMQTGAPAPESFGSRDLELPPGSEILSVQTVSLQPGVERVLVFAQLPDGGSRILVLDPLRGTVGGEWRVPGAPDSGAAPQP